MKHASAFFVAAVLTAAASSAATNSFIKVKGAGVPAEAVNRPMLLDGVAAYVNSHIITISDVMNEVRRAPIDDIAPAEREAHLRKLYQVTLDAMIDRRLILDSAKKAKVALQPWAVDERVREIIANNFDGDRTKLHALLADHKISIEEWRKNIEEDLTINALRYQEVEKRVTPTPTEIRAAYDADRGAYSTEKSVSVSMITLEPSGDSVSNRAAKIFAALKDHSKEFGDLAKEYSSDSKAVTGGSWGKVDPDEMFRPELAKAIAKLRLGEVSPLIQVGSYGYIVRKDQQQDARVLTFDEAHTLVEAHLKMQRSEQLYKAWIARLRSEAYIKVFELPKR